MVPRFWRHGFSALTTVFATIFLFTVSTSAQASPDDRNYLEELNQIAGEPQNYFSPVPGPTKLGAASFQLDPFECTLYPSVVHLRASSGYGSVGAKPYTRCLAGSPTYIKQSSSLYMVEWSGLSYVHLVTREARANYSANLTQQNVEWFCKNLNSSRFTQITNGSTLQRSTVYYAKVQTLTVTIGCGK